MGTQNTEEIDSGSASGSLSPEIPEEEKRAFVPLLAPIEKSRTRGKALSYSGSFEVAWRSYGRKEEKLRAYKEWIVQAPSVGGETRLLQLILAALKWQAPEYAAEGWKFAKYFERYLRARKWEDEPRPAAAPANGVHRLPPSVQAGRDSAARFISRGGTK